MNLKQQAARKALEFVQSGMTLGLGSGSTTAYFVEMLGESIRQGRLTHIKGVPTSLSTAQQARSLGIPLVRLSEHPNLDLAVDGADEVDPNFNLIKGLGRALLREKIVEIHAQHFIVIVDESKLVPALGRRFPLPLELVQFEHEVQIAWLNTLGCRAELWLEEDGAPAITDNGNYLARCWFDNDIPDAYALAEALSQRPGIVEHGLFLDMADTVIVAGEDQVRVLNHPKGIKI
jgi:ribose 5-phosphate isomerase A